MDFETFVGSVDIREVGAYRYANAPDAEILCCAFALGDEEPQAWHCLMEEWECDHLQKYFNALRDPEVLIMAHSAMFESAICQALLQRTWGIPAPDLGRFRCTMSLARRASLPGKLEKLAEVLHLQNQKDNRGKLLIKKFCEMQKPKKPTKKNPAGLPERRILPSDEPEAFAELLAYCKQDVRTEQEVARKLTYFGDEINDRNYTLDQRINARGVPVNLSALRHAQKLIDEETALISAKFRELTGFEVTQNAVLLKWLGDVGTPLPNLQAETIESFLKDRDYDSGLGCQALRLKQFIAYASIKKVQTMLDCAGPQDNRLRGLLNHHAASTGRWTSSLVQLQNLKRPTIKHSEDAYREICAGVGRDMLDICYGPTLEVISSCVRHFLHPVCPQCSGTGEGDMELEGVLSCSMCGACHEPSFLDADYSGIEARIVCWLASQEDALQRFRRYDAAPKGPQKKALDPYRIQAADTYRVPIELVNDFPQRFVGKGLVLGAGFGLGYDRFRESCMEKGYDLPEGMEYTAVKSWRAKHAKVVQWWDDLESAAKKAILRKNVKFDAGKVSFMCKDIEGMPFLLMRLPSGRKLAYPKPRITPSRFPGKTNITYFGQIPMTQRWGDISMWGGVLANNSTQGTAADIMAHGAHNCEREGYEIVTLVHDQAIANHGEGQTIERFVELLTDLPPWAVGLPVAAEGDVVPFYRKS